MTTKPNIKLEACCFWECHKIGINVIVDDRYTTGYDLTLEEAKELNQYLYSAIIQYEFYERQSNEQTTN